MNAATGESKTPAELVPYTEQIREIERLGKLFTEHNVPFGEGIKGLADLAAVIAFNAMRNRGDLEGAYKHMVDYLREVAEKHGLE